MVVKARVLGWGLHKSMSFIQLPQESHKCKISLQIWNSFNQNEARYDIPIFVLSNYYLYYQAGCGKNILVQKYTGYCSIPYQYTCAPWQ